MKAAIGIVGLVLVPVLTIATLRAGRREQPSPDPKCWKRETAEPWGTIVLVVFFLAPPVVWARDLIGWKVSTALLIAGLVGLAVVRTRAITGIYRLTVGEAAIEVRTGLRHISVPLDDVLSVTSLLDETLPPEVHLSAGRSIVLPDSDAHARAVATSSQLERPVVGCPPARLSRTPTVGQAQVGAPQVPAGHARRTGGRGCSGVSRRAD